MIGSSIKGLLSRGGLWGTHWLRKVPVPGNLEINARNSSSLGVVHHQHIRPTDTFRPVMRGEDHLFSLDQLWGKETAGFAIYPFKFVTYFADRAAKRPGVSKIPGASGICHVLAQMLPTKDDAVARRRELNRLAQRRSRCTFPQIEQILPTGSSLMGYRETKSTEGLGP